MKKDETKVEEKKVDEEVLEEEDFFDEDDYDEKDLELAKKIHVVKGKAKKVGKIALVIGGIAVLGVVGVGVAVAVGAAKKEEEESKKHGYDYDRSRSDRSFDGGSYRETYSEPATETEESSDNVTTTEF